MMIFTYPNIRNGENVILSPLLKSCIFCETLVINFIFRNLFSEFYFLHVFIINLKIVMVIIS